MVFCSLLRRREVLFNRVDALDHLAPYETVQPEIRGTFHLDKFNPGQIAMHPPHVGLIDRQRLVLIGEHQAQGDVLFCQQGLIGLDRASHCRKIPDRPFANGRYHTVHSWAGDWQAVETALVGFDLFHCGAQCNGGRGLGVFPIRRGERGVAWSSSCSRNAHAQKVLVRRAHLRINQAAP
jgi:hypothetical protein